MNYNQWWERACWSRRKREKNIVLHNFPLIPRDITNQMVGGTFFLQRKIRGITCKQPWFLKKISRSGHLTETWGPLIVHKLNAFFFSVSEFCFWLYFSKVPMRQTGRWIGHVSVMWKSCQWQWVSLCNYSHIYFSYI